MSISGILKFQTVVFTGGQVGGTLCNQLIFMCCFSALSTLEGMRRQQNWLGQIYALSLRAIGHPVVPCGAGTISVQETFAAVPISSHSA